VGLGWKFFVLFGFVLAMEGLNKLRLHRPAVCTVPLYGDEKLLPQRSNVKIKQHVPWH
jgi:hypothetical protein